MKTSSTVAAVEALLDDKEHGYSSAAIASSVCERLFDGIQLLWKGIQDEACKSLLFAPVPPPCTAFVKGVTYLILACSSQQISRGFISLPDRSMDNCRRPPVPTSRVHVQSHGPRVYCESVNNKATIRRLAPRPSVRGSVSGHAGLTWQAYCQQWICRSVGWTGVPSSA